MTREAMRVAAADGTFDLHVSVPAAPNGNAAVLLQEIFGVTEKVRRYCDLFAGLGLTVAAPDLFWRFEPRLELPYTRDGTLRAFEILKQFDEEKALADIEAAAAALRRRPEVTGQVAVIGFCLGGKLAARLAARGGIAAAVSFYGVGIETFAAELRGSPCPLQLHFAERDRFIPAEARDTIAAAVRERADTELYVYDADHAFFRSELDDPASASSFDRAVRFLGAAGIVDAPAGRTD